MNRLSHLLAAVVAAVALSLATGGAARPADSPALRVTVIGGGVVRTTDGRIHCKPRCSTSYRRGVVRWLAATPARFFSFVRWEGDCIGTAPSCVIAMDRSAAVRAVFARDLKGVVVTAGGPGKIVSKPSGIECGAGQEDCLGIFGQGTTITLMPVPSAGGRFVAWNGPCASAGPRPCRLRLGQNLGQVAGAFGHASPGGGPQMLTVTASGPSIRVTSQPPGIDCPAMCAASFPSGTLVTLSLNVGRWGGACTGYIPCYLVVDAPTEVSARQTVAGLSPVTPPRRATFDVTESGRGLVVADDDRIECGRSGRPVFRCHANEDTSTETVLLRALPGRRARFGGWRGGSCRGVKTTCRVDLPLDRSREYTVLAFFRR